MLPKQDTIPICNAFTEHKRKATHQEQFSKLDSDGNMVNRHVILVICENPFHAMIGNKILLYKVHHIKLLLRSCYIDSNSILKLSLQFGLIVSFNVQHNSVRRGGIRRLALTTWVILLVIAYCSHTTMMHLVSDIINQNHRQSVACLDIVV